MARFGDKDKCIERRIRRAERRQQRYAESCRWHDVWSVFPRYMGDCQWVWLERVRRRRNDDDWDTRWEYQHAEYPRGRARWDWTHDLVHVLFILLFAFMTGAAIYG